MHSIIKKDAPQRGGNRETKGLAGRGLFVKIPLPAPISEKLSFMDYSNLLGSNEGAAALSFVIVPPGYAGSAGRLRSKHTLHFSPAMGAAHR